MLNILAISDKEEPPEIEALPVDNIDVIVSCGDLRPGYLSCVRTKMGDPQGYLVYGNHDENFEGVRADTSAKRYSLMHCANDHIEATLVEQVRQQRANSPATHHGMSVLERETAVIKQKSMENLERDIYIGGFSGALSEGNPHHKRPFYFTERMAHKFYRKLRRQHFFSRQSGIDIMISHTPPLLQEHSMDVDHFHRPSQGLGRVREHFQPLLWFYGHIHPYEHGKQQLDFGPANNSRTYLLNAVPYKVVQLDEQSGDVHIPEQPHLYFEGPQYS